MSEGVIYCSVGGVVGQYKIGNKTAFGMCGKVRCSDKSCSAEKGSCQYQTDNKPDE